MKIKDLHKELTKLLNNGRGNSNVVTWDDVMGEYFEVERCRLLNGGEVEIVSGFNVYNTRSDSDSYRDY
ncbi:MAG: hypothetical protein GY861_22335 [bacterium]|nr:hypothetical protein [bacterium]